MSIRKAASYLFALSLVASSVAYRAPSTQRKFTKVLTSAKLQYPDSGLAATSEELLDGFATSYFHLTRDLYMAFEVAGPSNRSELREMETDGEKTAWDCTGSTKHVATSTMALPIQEEGIEEVTMMQIHDTLTSPALRISWVRNITIDGVNSQNVIISTIRLGLESDSATNKTVLLPHTLRPVDYSIMAQDGEVTVKVNGVTKLDRTSIAPYAGSTCYFKAGAYNNNPTIDEAFARNKFYRLEW
ncbi:alginate lyase 2 [Calycina marina]|uniref:Alginate lyase 2 n=1 Tax=Calycina marina TaxID=1763456 RepID=A0A9P8CGE0_9HELO|nr:alginate lyase 2 [Calycina marina]